MKSELFEHDELLKTQGLTEEQSRRMLEEKPGGDHNLSDDTGAFPSPSRPSSIYAYHDLLADPITGQNMPVMQTCLASQIRSIDDLLERDKQREKDGFPRKIRVGRLIKPGKGGKDKVVVVPSTVEEKLYHDNSFKESSEDSPAGGSGNGEEGEVIGEEPVRPQKGSGAGPGQGEGGPHEMESSAYDLGKILTEKFELPNLKEKGKKRSLTRYTYDMTDRHRGFGQFLDKKATLKKILETNIHLGNAPDIADIDLTSFLISPGDKIYRILSREKDYESQAMVFFLRDYSGSMSGKPTELIVSQHVMIYSWLLYQYEKQVESRFILHDTEAKEVPDFYTYYNSQVAGGTMVASAFKLVNEIVQNENLAQDYNIYVFHGTDGDDWDVDGKEAIPAITRMLTYTSRVGITIAEHGTGTSGSTEVEKYLKKSNLLTTNPKLIRIDTMSKDADEPRLIEGIKRLIS
ncbi:MAG: DUF444 family protein [Deltaproteobacteria bacterium]|nr:DUF444 family protein [Deltaproteobacteria bacterium]